MNFKLLELFNDVSLHDGAAGELFRHLQNANGISLPEDHEQLLRFSNGIEAYGGYIRLFGIDTLVSVDANRWNDHEYWKFAWGNRCVNYWCFAETAWGDQFAYLSESLHTRKPSPIYFLDAFSMRPQVVASSFEEFFEKEFLRWAKEPYDLMTVEVRRKLGALELSSHLVYVPSVLLGGSEDINHVEKMNARAAMVCNGDIALQLEAAPPERDVKEVQLYEDEMHRARLRLVWT